MRTIKCCSVVFGVTLRLLVTNTSSSSPAVNKHCRLPATSVRVLSTCRGSSRLSALQLAFTARDGARIWLRIAIFCLPICIRRNRGGFPSEHRHGVWYWKTRMVWLPDGETFLKIRLFVLTESTKVTDRRTDTSYIRLGWTDLEEIRQPNAEWRTKYGDMVKIETGSRIFQYGGRLIFQIS